LFILLFILVVVGLPALLVGIFTPTGQLQGRQQGPLVRLKLQSGQVITLPLEEYLIGVVAAEMPAEFHPEALKAQAVAARTYALCRMSTNNGSVVGADLSSDPDRSQAWIPVSEMRRRWGLLYFGYYYRKLAAAVQDTDGEVVAYHGQLIDPVYFSSCGGLGTEDAEDVWGRDIPYLRGVPCSWCPPLEQQYVAAPFTRNSLLQHLGMKSQDVPAGTRLDGLIRIIDRTPRGRVKELRVGNRVFEATDFRRLLGLRSTAFTVSVVKGKIILETRGDGHAVGMCQWGAQGLALQGKNYRDILTYYYRGVQVVRWLPEFGK
jgi:stage II sporulation protein D